VLKKKYMIVVILTIALILLWSLLYSNLAFGANGSSGSWGAIRFVEPNESMENQSIWKDAATFNWTPGNGTNNAILSVMFYVEHKAASEGFCSADYRFKINNWISEEHHTEPNTTYSLSPLCGYYYKMPKPNQGNYEIKLQFQRSHTSSIGVYIRNINIIIIVADGMVPNEYYKVELPSEAVGGFCIPVDKFSLLAPYIALVSTIILAVSISVAYIKYKKKQ